MLSSQQFDSRFITVANNADGNCLFESIEHLLSGSVYEKEHGVITAENIREAVGEFYRNFDKDIDYPEQTIEYRIKIDNLFDNMDDEMPHDYNIWNDKVWANMTDVLICSLIFEINIDLYTYVSEYNTYRLEKITSQYDYKKTVNLLYNGVNHFEALCRN
jgi:hypothetical protein